MDRYHALLHQIGHVIGHEIPGDAPGWLHTVLHVVLIWTPLALLVLVMLRVARFLAERIAWKKNDLPTLGPTGLPGTVFRFIWRYSARSQMLLIAGGLVSLPVLYATLELPKTIINSGIEAGEHTTFFAGYTLSQLDHLLLLCAFYLLAVLANGFVKFVLNIHKGKVGERLLRRLRLTVFHRWRRGAGSERRSEVIPLVVQEVEPIGGFAADAFALPVFQGGTFLTILIFMFVQDPFLGAAAITLLPLQIAIIPRLQRRINILARRRVAEVRALGGSLGDQGATDIQSIDDIRTIGASLKEIESIRLQIHRVKFFMKALNNFLSALTPFFFYSIGGYLVIEGELTLGALVAVLAAYKDFSAPLKELFRYYQSMEDVRIRYQEITRFVSAKVPLTVVGSQTTALPDSASLPRPIHELSGEAG